MEDLLKAFEDECSQLMSKHKVLIEDIGSGNQRETEAYQNSGNNSCFDSQKNFATNDKNIEYPMGNIYIYI